MTSLWGRHDESVLSGSSTIRTSRWSSCIHCLLLFPLGECSSLGRVEFRAILSSDAFIMKTNCTCCLSRVLNTRTKVGCLACTFLVYMHAVNLVVLSVVARVRPRQVRDWIVLRLIVCYIMLLACIVRLIIKWCSDLICWGIICSSVKAPVRAENTLDGHLTEGRGRLQGQVKGSWSAHFCIHWWLSLLAHHRLEK